MTLYQLTTLGGSQYFVVSSSPTHAQEKLVGLLNLADYGFTRDRKVTVITVIAEELTEFPEGKPHFSSGNNLIL